MLCCHSSGILTNQPIFVTMPGGSPVIWITGYPNGHPATAFAVENCGKHQTGGLAACPVHLQAKWHKWHSSLPKKLFHMKSNYPWSESLKHDFKSKKKISQKKSDGGKPSLFYWVQTCAACACASSASILLSFVTDRKFPSNVGFASWAVSITSSTARGTPPSCPM